ncbi:DDE_3 domain-containing protein [Trichonephila clavipes]|nr:DDE_3 domain-containing protein [Trichonephila clavipes]
MGADFLFMDDNAHPHRANFVDECLQSEDIPRMDWPAYSPDLNPIDHMCDMLGRRIAALQPPLTCLPKLRRALLDEWCNIPQVQIDNLILSMPRRSEISIFCVFKVAIAENPNSQRYDVEFGNSIRNAFVFSAEDSASTSILNSKKDYYKIAL